MVPLVTNRAASLRKELGCEVFELADGGILAAEVVADDGIGHGRAHLPGWGWFGCRCGVRCETGALGPPPGMANHGHSSGTAPGHGGMAAIGLIDHQEAHATINVRPR